MKELIEVTARGIPATLCCTDGDWDDYELCDRNGRPAPWIEHKMKRGDWDDVERQLSDALQREALQREACYANEVDWRIKMAKEARA